MMKRKALMSCLLLVLLGSLSAYGVIIQEDDAALKEIYTPDEGSYAQTTPYGLTVEVRWGGATGDMGAYINTNNEDGMFVRYEYDAPAAGDYELYCRFALGKAVGTSNRDGQVSINGVDVGTLLLPGTGAWDAWDISNSLSITLNEGINEIVINGPATGSLGLANIDYIAIVPEPATMALLGLGGLMAIRRKRS